MSGQVQGKVTLNEVVVGPTTWTVLGVWDRHGADARTGACAVVAHDSVTTFDGMLALIESNFPAVIPDAVKKILRGAYLLWVNHMPSGQLPLPPTTSTITVSDTAFQRSIDNDAPTYGIYHTFTITRAGIYTIDVKNVSLSDSDTYVYLFKGATWAGRDTSFNNPPGIGPNFDVAGMLYNDDDRTVPDLNSLNSKLITDTVQLAPGTYVIEVTTNAPGVTGDVTAVVRQGAWPSPSSDLGPPSSESPITIIVDDPPTPYTIDGTIEAVQRTSDTGGRGVLSYGGYFTFTVVTPGIYTIDVGPNGLLGINDTYLYLFKGSTLANQDPIFNRPVTHPLIPNFDRPGMLYNDDDTTGLRPSSSSKLITDPVHLTAGVYVIEATSKAPDTTGPILVQVRTGSHTSGGGGGGGGGLTRSLASS